MKKAVLYRLYSIALLYFGLMIVGSKNALKVSLIVEALKIIQYIIFEKLWKRWLM